MVSQPAMDKIVALTIRMNDGIPKRRAFGAVERKLAGKTIGYEVEVKAIKKKVLPELTDDFAKELGEFETIDAFKETLREQAGAEKRRQLENAAKDALVKSGLDPIAPGMTN